MHTPDRWGDKLQRRLGLWSAVAVLVGSTIGSGIFRTPSGVAQLIPDVPLFFFAWFIGGVVVVCGALTYGELAASFPRSGGIYVFLREAWGPLPAFLFGWAELLIIRPGAYGAIGITASAYALRTLGFDPAATALTVPGLELAIRSEQLLGAIFIAVVATVNYYGIHRGALLQNASTAFKVGALVALVLLGFAVGSAAQVEGGILGQRGAVGISPFLLAMVSILWAYDGWADVSFIGGEVKDPQRTLPRTFLIGTAIVVVLYLSANLVYLYLIPIADMTRAELVAADAARLLVGPIGATLISGAIAISTFGTLNGTMMTSPRIFFAMSQDGVFPKAIGKVHPVTGAPTSAVLLAASLGTIFILIRQFTELAEQFIIGIWPFYALAVLGLFRLRRTQPNLERPYKTPGYPVVPVAFLLGALFLLGNYLVSKPGAFLLDIGVILVGVPVFFGWQRWRRRDPPVA
jgi:basic amino acid/polyamine antiporter, APA family